MTPPAAANALPRPTRPGGRTAAPRRAGGAAGQRPAARRGVAPARVARPQGAPTTAGTLTAPPLGLRIARALAAVPDSRPVDRMIRGRVWIAVLAALLVGIVFLQISLLKLNTGISRAVQTQQTFERQNSSLKSDLSALGGGERVQESAAVMGFVTPTTGQPRFVDARKASASRAAANITAPTPIEQLPLGMIPPTDGGTGVTTVNPVSVTTADPVSTPSPVAAAPPVPAPTPAAAPVAVTPAPAATPIAAPTPTPAAAPVAPPVQASAPTATGGLAAGGQG